MGWLDRWLRKNSVQNGGPIVIKATGTVEGISLEFSTLEKMFGMRDVDWRLHDRLVDQREDGRVIERFILSHQGNRREVEFDITSFYGIASSGTLGDIVNRTKARAAATSIKILMPLNVSSTLAMVVLGIKKNAELARVVDADAIVAAMNNATFAADDTQEIQLPKSVWIGVLGLLRSVRPSGLLDQELIEDLKAYIDGGLKASRSEK